MVGVLIVRALLFAVFIGPLSASSLLVEGCQSNASRLCAERATVGGWRYLAGPPPNHKHPHQPDIKTSPSSHVGIIARKCGSQDQYVNDLALDKLGLASLIQILGTREGSLT